MLHEVKNILYKITIYGCLDMFVESETLKELYEFIVQLELRGYSIIRINEIKLSGKTPRIAFKGDSAYKVIFKEAIRERDTNGKVSVRCGILL